MLYFIECDQQRRSAGIQGKLRTRKRLYVIEIDNSELGNLGHCRGGHSKPAAQCHHFEEQNVLWGVFLWCPAFMKRRYPTVMRFGRLLSWEGMRDSGSDLCASHVIPFFG